MQEVGNRMEREYDSINYNLEPRVGTLDVKVYFYEECSEYFDSLEIEDVEIEYYDDIDKEFNGQELEKQLSDCGFSHDWIEKFGDDVADVVGY